MSRMLTIRWGLVPLLILASAALATIQSKWLWGYWVSRPDVPLTVASVRPTGLVAVLFQDGAGLSAPTIRDGDVTRIMAPKIAACRRQTNECLEGRLLTEVENAETAPILPPAFVSRVWHRSLVDLPIPTAADGTPEFRLSSGIVLRFEREGAQYAAIAYRTNELSNDNYVYSEAVYEIRGEEELRRVAAHRFRYDVAGIEFLQWHVLFVLNTVVVMVVMALAFLLRRRLRISRHPSPGNSRMSA